MLHALGDEHPVDPCIRVRLAQDRVQGRRHDEDPPIPPVETWYQSHGVPSHDETATLLVPDRECEASTQLVEQRALRSLVRQRDERRVRGGLVDAELAPFE